jgi:hypothetical protein
VKGEHEMDRGLRVLMATPEPALPIFLENRLRGRCPMSYVLCPMPICNMYIHIQ